MTSDIANGADPAALTAERGFNQDVGTVHSEINRFNTNVLAQ
jgi:hypothetical protein